MMKKTAYILTLLLTSLTFGQSPIIDLLDDDGSALSGAYYKDVNNLLNPFEGTYVYSNGNTTFKIVLKKKVMQYNREYYEDLIIGEYEYTVNGLVVMNTLQEIDIVYDNQILHNIDGNFIIDYNEFIMWKCLECPPNEIRLMLTIKDVSTNRLADMFLRRTTNVFGQEIIKVKIANVNRVNYHLGESLPPDFSLPQGEFTMIKQ